MIKLLISVLLLTVCYYGQTIIRVTDKLTGEGILNVAIYQETNQNIIYSDSSGYADISNFSKFSKICLKHLSYLSDCLEFNYMLNKRIISLVPKIIEMPESEIEGNKDYEINSVKLNLNYKNRLTESTFSEILNKNTSLLLKDYGGNGGLKTISYKGLTPENTLVLFNEARINDIRTGSFDLSVLENVSVDQLVFSDSETGIENFSSGGVLKLSKGDYKTEDKTIAGIKSGSFGYNSFYTDLHRKYDNISLSLSFSRTYAANNYRYTFEKNELERENANYGKTFTGIAFNHISGKSHLKLYSHYSFFENGLPGFVVTNNYNSGRVKSTTESYLATLLETYSFSNAFTIKLSAKYQFQNLDLYDPDGILFLNSERQNSKVYEYGFKLITDFKLTEKLSIDNSIEVDFGRIDSIGRFVSANNVNQNPHQFNLAFSSGIKFNFEGFKFYSAAKYSFTKYKFNSVKNYNELSYKIIGEYSISNNLTFYSSVSNGFRFPTINEKYYSYLFNHYEIEPEKYLGLSFGINYSINYAIPLNVSTEVYRIKGRNKIIWFPFRSIFQTPRNISEITNIGFTFKLSSEGISDLLKFSFIYDYLQAIDNTVYDISEGSLNKQLVYTPKNRIKFNIELMFNNLFLGISGHFSDRSYFTIDNTLRNSLNPYMVTDGYIMFNKIIFGISHSFGVTVYNIFNKEYMNVQSFPMPLRTIILNYGVSFL